MAKSEKPYWPNPQKDGDSLVEQYSKIECSIPSVVRFRTVSYKMREDWEPLYPGKVSEPDRAYSLFMSMFRDLDDDVEHGLCIFLDSRHRIIGTQVSFSGTRNRCPVDPGRIWRSALYLGATGVIFAHNHPSGELEPSGDDLALTKRLYQGGDLIGVTLLDSIIIVPQECRYLSLYYSRPECFQSKDWSQS